MPAASDPAAASKPIPAAADSDRAAGYQAGWPPTENDLPVVTDPNYCIDLEESA